MVKGLPRKQAEDRRSRMEGYPYGRSSILDSQSSVFLLGTQVLHPLDLIGTTLTHPGKSLTSGAGLSWLS